MTGFIVSDFNDKQRQSGRSSEDYRRALAAGKVKSKGFLIGALVNSAVNLLASFLKTILNYIIHSNAVRFFTSWRCVQFCNPAKPFSVRQSEPW